MFSMADVQRVDKQEQVARTKVQCVHILRFGRPLCTAKPPSHKSGKNAACSTRLQMLVWVCERGQNLQPSTICRNFRICRGDALKYVMTVTRSLPSIYTCAILQLRRTQHFLLLLTTMLSTCFF